MSSGLIYRFVLGLLISLMTLTVSYATVKIWLSDQTAELVVLGCDWEDSCDDEDGERKENKTKERLDDCLEFSLLNMVGSANHLSLLQKSLPLGQYELSAVHLEIIAPPPKA